MPRYVDGFVIPIKKSKLAAYKKMAVLGAKVWKSHGALEYMECVGDDLKCDFAKPFPKLAKTKAGETVMFSFIVFKSRAHRDQVNKKAMKDKRLAAMMTQPMPFDCRRMGYGGFKVLVDA